MEEITMKSSSSGTAMANCEKVTDTREPIRNFSSIELGLAVPVSLGHLARERNQTSLEVHKYLLPPQEDTSHPLEINKECFQKEENLSINSCDFPEEEILEKHSVKGEEIPEENPMKHEIIIPLFCHSNNKCYKVGRSISSRNVVEGLLDPSPLPAVHFRSKSNNHLELPFQIR